MVVVSMLSCLFVGCNRQTAVDVSTSNKDLEHVYIEATNRYGVHEFAIPEFQIAEDIVYIPDDEKASWREPLIDFLSTLHAYDYTVEYPPNEDIPGGYTAHMQGSDGIGLIDVDGKGAPEIAEWFQDGGTASNSSIKLYKFDGTVCGYIHTGWIGEVVVYQDEENHMLHSLDGTLYGDWSMYVDDFGKFITLGTYNYGNMITTTEHYVSELCYDIEDDIYFNKDQYHWFRDIDNIYESTADTRIHITIDYGYYFKKDKDYKTQVCVTEVESYLADLVSRYRLVEGSQLIIIEWEHIEGYGTLSQEELAVKMADALINSQQKFIRSNIDK